MKKVFICPDQLSKSPAPISFGIKVEGKSLLFTAGIVSTDFQGNVVGNGNMKKQTRQFMENLKIILNEAGASFEDVIKVTMYLTDISKLNEVIEIRSEYLKGNRPVATAVEVSKLAKNEFMIEIELTAIMD